MGKTNNPAGSSKRARKGDALRLTETLRATLAREEPGAAAFGLPTRRSELLAELVTRLVLTGETTLLPDATGSRRTVELSAMAWADFVKWLYLRVDGQPPQQVRLPGEGDGTPVAGTIMFVMPGNGRGDDTEEIDDDTTAPDADAGGDAGVDTSGS